MTPMKKLCLLLLAALAATGCNEDSASEIFSGKDNHIASFALTKDGVTYDAVISQNRITVTVPYNVSLAGATATYELSEKLRYNPHPRPLRIGNRSGSFWSPPTTRRIGLIFIRSNMRMSFRPETSP